MNNRELSDLCEVQLYTELDKDDKYNAIRYLLTFLGYPDSRGEFSRKIGKAKYLFRIPLLSRLIAGYGIDYYHRQGYGALMLYHGRDVIGHTAFQIHNDNTLHVFSTSINKEYEHQGLGVLLWEEIIKIARRKNISRIKFGKGGHPFAVKAYDVICAKSTELGIISQKDYWVRII